MKLLITVVGRNEKVIFQKEATGYVSLPDGIMFWKVEGNKKAPMTIDKGFQPIDLGDTLTVDYLEKNGD